MSPWNAAESRESYRQRIDQTLDYINEHLSGEIHLEQVAAAASFSPFHFHRIFSAVVGETPGDFINRVRLERAANALLKNPGLPVTEIAMVCGFSSSAAFARSFKKHFGIPASQYRDHQGIAAWPTAPYSPILLPQSEEWASRVQVKCLPRLPVVYISNLEGYRLDKICAAWELLYRWTAARDLIGPQTLAIGVSFDDPLITPDHRCRYYACLTVPERTPIQGPVGYMEIAAGRYAVCRTLCDPDQIQYIYRAIYGLWLLDSSLQLADRPAFEIYHQTPENHPEGKYDLEVCLPVI